MINMNNFVILPILIPLLSAILLIFMTKNLMLMRIFSTAASAIGIVISGILVQLYKYAANHNPDGRCRRAEDSHEHKVLRHENQKNSRQKRDQDWQNNKIIHVDHFPSFDPYLFF